MNVIRFNWKLIRKLALFLIILYIFKVIIVSIYYLNKKPTLIYDYKHNYFSIRNLNYSYYAVNAGDNREYSKIKLNCVNFYYYKLLPNLWPNLIETITSLKNRNFNCLNINIAWNLYSFNFQNDEKVYEFENRYYNLNTLLNLIASYKLYVVVNLNAAYSTSYIDYAGLPYWLLSGVKTENFFDTIFIEYSIYLENLFTYLTDNQLLYRQNGPIVGFIIDHEINLFETKSSMLNDLMYKYSIYDSLLKEYHLDDEEYNTISIILPQTYLNYTQFRHLKFHSGAFKQEQNYWGNGNSRETLWMGNKFNEILLNLLNQTNYSLVLYNYHCFHNSHTLNGASLFKNLQNQLHYKPFSNEIKTCNCFINSNIEPTNNYYFLNESAISEENPTNKFSKKINLEYYLNFKKFVDTFELFNPPVKLNKTSLNINFEDIIDVNYLKLSSNSAISNSDATFLYYTAKVMLPKGTLVNIKKNLFADYLIFKCDDKQLLSLNRMNYDQHYLYDKNIESSKNQITFKLNDDCYEFNVIVENMGRLNDKNLNVKKILTEKKGLFNKNSITVGQEESFIDNWVFYPINLENLITKNRLFYNSKWELLNIFDKTFNSLNFPTFFYTRIDLNANTDLANLLNQKNATYLYLSMVNWVKGYVIWNGYYLGRYWSTMGPLCTLKLPNSIINFDGINELIIMEMHNINQFYVKITNMHEYSPCLTNMPN